MFRFSPEVVTAVAVVFAAGFLVALVLSFRETIRDLGTLFEWRVVRRSLRGLVRFRMSILFAVFGLIQVSLAFVLWLTDRGYSGWYLEVSIALLVLMLVFYWCCFRDFAWRTSTARYRSIVARRSVEIPDHAGPPRARKPGSLVKRFARPRSRISPRIGGTRGVRIG